MVEVPPDCLLPEPVPDTIHCALAVSLVMTAVVVMLVFAQVYPRGRSDRLYHLLLGVR